MKFKTLSTCLVFSLFFMAMTFGNIAESKPKVGAPCDDGNRCTEKDVIQLSGVCKGVVKYPPFRLGPCESFKCDAATGKFSKISKADGIACNDKNLCTSNDKCLAGVCKGPAILCPQDQECNKTTGKCEVKAVVQSESDFDNDGKPDSSDNCPAVANADQLDSDKNGLGDVCECGEGMVMGWKKLAGLTESSEVIQSFKGVVCSGGGKIYCYKNGNWQNDSAGFEGGPGVEDLLVYNGTLYVAAGQTGVYRLKDVGMNWEHIGGETPKIRAEDIQQLNGKLYVASTTDDTGVYYFNGDTWVAMNEGFDMPNGVESLTTYQDKLFAHTMDGIYYHEGGSWHLFSSNGLPPPWYDTYALYGVNNILYAVGKNGVYYYKDNQWQKINELGDLYAVVYKFAGGVFAGGAESKLYRSNDGLTDWKPDNKGLPNWWVTSMTTNDGILYIGHNEGVFSYGCISPP